MIFENQLTTKDTKEHEGLFITFVHFVLFRQGQRTAFVFKELES